MAGRADKARHAIGAVALTALVVAWWAVRFRDPDAREALDTTLYFLPSYVTIAEHFRAGSVPLWNPYQLCGIPWIGTLQSGVFYPPHVLYLLLPLHVAFALSGVLHLTLAALATAAFVRRLGLGAAAAWLAAVVFALRGTVGTSPPSPNLLEAIAWLPVGALALVELVRAPAGRPIALLAAATGSSFLAGYPQPTVYIVYTWASLFLALLIQERPSTAGIATRIGAFTAALMLGATLAAVQLLPALELMGAGTRAAEGLTDRTMFPVAPWITPATGVLRWRTIAGTPYAVGLLALALVPAALLAPARRAIAVWALVVSALSIVWALGRATPLFDLYLALPALRLFRNPGRLLVITDFAVAIAAAFGLSAVASGKSPRPWPRLAAVALTALVLAGILTLVRRGWAPEAEVTTFTAVIVVAIVALLVAPASWRPALAAAIAVAATIEIAGNPGSEFRLPYAATDRAAYEVIGPDLTHLARMAGHDRVWRAQPGIATESAQKLSTWYRLRTTGDYEPVNLQRQADFFTYLRDGSTTATRLPWLFDGDVSLLDAPPGGTSPASRRRLLDLAAVRWVAFRHGALMAPAVQRFVDQARLVRRASMSKLLVFENPHALPRAFVTYRTRSAPAEPDVLLDLLGRDTFDPLVESVVEGPPPFVAAADAPPRGHAATFVRDDETDVELEVTLERPGLVVLADSFFPGWRATVDGKAAPIVATNHLFRGVPAPAGTHRVRFQYAPASLYGGGAMSAAAAWVLIMLWRRRRDPRDGPYPNP